jgi:hypothetical protein
VLELMHAKVRLARTEAVYREVLESRGSSPAAAAKTMA